MNVQSLLLPGRLARYLLPLGCLVLPSFPALAGEGVFTTGGPYGGGVRSLALDPNDPDTVYAVATGLFETNTQGDLWTRMSADHPRVRDYPLAMAVNPQSSSHLWVGTDQGLFFTSDGGEIWQEANIGVAFEPIDWVSYASAPTQSDILYLFGTLGGLRQSLDFGFSWSSVAIPASRTYGVIVDSWTSSTHYAATSEGFFKSTNSGSSWTQMNQGLPGSLVYDLAQDRAFPSGVIYAATHDGLFKSVNRGQSWTEQNGGLSGGIFGLYATSVAVSPSTIYAAMYGGGIFTSLNEGHTWSLSPGTEGKRFVDLALDFDDPGTVYAASAHEGVFRSDDGGATWQAVTSGLTAVPVIALAENLQAPGHLYAGSDGAASRSLFTSENQGATWTSPPFTPSGVIEIISHPTDAGVIYAATTSGGVYKSSDGGENWGWLSGGLPTSQLTALAMDPSNAEILYVATTFDGVFKTLDGGEHWSDSSSGIPTASQLRVIRVDPQSPSIVYGLSSLAGFRSTDGGAQWSPLVFPDSFVVLNDLAIDHQEPQRIYVASENRGIYRSDDGGATWVLSNLGPPFEPTALAIDPTDPSTILVGCERGFLLRSTNFGDTWTEVEGLNAKSIHRFLFSSTDPGLLHVATTGAGVRSLFAGSLIFLDGFESGSTGAWSSSS